MFHDIYTNPIAKGEESKAEAMVEYLFGYYKKNEEVLTGEYRKLLENGESLDRVVADYVAGMTDKYAVTKFTELTVPKAWGIY